MKRKSTVLPPYAVAALDYKGIVVQRALSHFESIPQHLRGLTSVDDLISEGMLFVGSKVLANCTGTRKAARHDISRGAISTLVHTAVNNFFIGYVKSLTCRKRGAVTVSYDEDPLVISGVGRWSRNDLCDSESIVTEMHLRASRELFRFLDDHFFTGECTSTSVIRSKKFVAIKDEFQKLAKRYGVTIDHYRVVIRKEKLRQCQEQH